MYIAFFFGILYFHIINHIIKLNNRTQHCIFISLYLILLYILSILRTNNIPDTEGYKDIYYYNSIDFVEEGFIYINKFFLNIGLDFNEFLFIYISILYIIYFITTSQITKYPHVAFLLFLPYFGFYYWGVIIRVALGISICYIGLIYLLKHKTFKGLFLYYTTIVIAIFIHQSTAIFLLFPLFIFKYINKYILYAILATALLLPIINIQNHLISSLDSLMLLAEFSPRLKGYIDNADINCSGMYALSKIKFLICGSFFIYARDYIIRQKKTYNSFVNIYILGIILQFAFYFIPAGGRLGEVCLYGEYILLALIYENFKLNKTTIITFILCNTIINYIMFIRLVPQMI